MKNHLSLLFVIMFIVLSINCKSTQASSRHLPPHFYGACSARLMDTLHTVCGRGGTSLLRNAYIRRRYRPRFRRNGAMLRRGRRDVQLTDDFQPTKPLTFQEARWLLFNDQSPLSSVILTGHEMHKERKVKKRVRRQISQDCCKNSCELEIIRRKYCNFRFG